MWMAKYGYARIHSHLHNLWQCAYERRGERERLREKRERENIQRWLWEFKLGSFNLSDVTTFVAIFMLFSYRLVTAATVAVPVPVTYRRIDFGHLARRFDRLFSSTLSLSRRFSRSLLPCIQSPVWHYKSIRVHFDECCTFHGIHKGMPGVWVGKVTKKKNKHNKRAKMAKKCKL